MARGYVSRRSCRAGRIFYEKGKMFWIKRSELEQYQLAVSFDQMICLFEDDTLGEQMVYEENGKIVRELL